MINSISWAGYFYAIGIIVIIYYAFVLLLYYRSELVTIFQQFKDRTNGRSSNAEAALEQYAIDIMETAAEEWDHNKARGLLLNIQSLAKESKQKHFAREELLLAFQQSLQQHTNLAGGILQNKINHFIIAASENYCSVHLSKEEVSALWSI